MKKREIFWKIFKNCRFFIDFLRKSLKTSLRWPPYKPSLGGPRFPRKKFLRALMQNPSLLLFYFTPETLIFRNISFLEFYIKIGENTYKLKIWNLALVRGTVSGQMRKFPKISYIHTNIKRSDDFHKFEKFIFHEFLIFCIRYDNSFLSKNSRFIRIFQFPLRTSLKLF